MVKARPRFSEARTLSQSAGSITLTLDAMRGLARVQILQGQLCQAVETYRQALQLADEVAQSEQAVPAAAPVHLELGDLLRERNQLDEAACHLAQGIELSRQWQILGEDLRNSYVFQARLKQARGDAAGALNVIRQAEQLAQGYQTVPRFGDPIAACRASLTLVQAVSIESAFDPGHLEAVGQWAEARGLRADGSIDSLDDEFEYLVWVRLLIAQNEPEQALQLLARLQQAPEDGGRTGRVIEILTLQALAQRALDDTEQALTALERALSLAEPEGYVRLFVDEGHRIWKNLREQDRQRYKAEKQQVAEQMIAQLDRRYPGLADQVEMCDVATPATFERYTGNWRASYMGWLFTPKMMMAQMDKTLPGLDNFYMIGQWVGDSSIPIAATSGRHVTQIICHKDKKPFVTTVP